MAIALESKEISINKKLVKPDKAKHEAEVNAINDDISKLKERLAAIRAELDSVRDGRSGMSEQMQSAKDRMVELRATKDKLIGERNVMSDSLKDSQGQLDDHSKSQKNLRQELKYTSAAEIDGQIAILDRKQGTQSMSLSEEKKVLKEIEALRKSKKLVDKYAGKQGQIDQTRDSVQVIRAKMADKKKEIDAVNALINEQKKVLDELRSSTPNTKDLVPQLVEERSSVKASLDEKYNTIRTLKIEFKEANNAFFAAVNLQREARKKAREAEEKRLQEEYQNKLALYELEMEKLHPFQEELAICDSLVAYLEGSFLAKAKASSSATQVGINARPTLEMDGMKPFQRKEEVYGSFPIKSKKVKAKKSKDIKLSFPIARMDSFSSIGITPPTTLTQVPRAIEEIIEKKKVLEACTRESKGESKEEFTNAPTSKLNGESKKEGKQKHRHFNASSAEFPILGGAGTPDPMSGVWRGPSSTSMNDTPREDPLKQEA